MTLQVVHKDGLYGLRRIGIFFTKYYEIDGPSGDKDWVFFPNQFCWGSERLAGEYYNYFINKHFANKKKKKPIVMCSISL